MPLGRQARKTADLGPPATTQLLSEVFLRAADLLKPIWDGVVSALSSTKCGAVNADGTPVKAPGGRKEGRLRSQMFVCASSWFEHPMAACDFSAAGGWARPRISSGTQMGTGSSSRTSRPRPTRPIHWPAASRGGAKRYSGSRWEAGMKTFLSDGRIGIPDDLAERSVKVYALSRRNFLFCKAKRGAEATGRLTALIQTGELSGLDAEGCLSWAMPDASSMAAEDLLPWPGKVPESVSAGLHERKNGAAEPPAGPVGEP